MCTARVSTYGWQSKHARAHMAARQVIDDEICYRWSEYENV